MEGVQKYVDYKIRRIGQTSAGAEKEINELALQGYVIVSTAAGGQNGEFLWVTMGRTEERRISGAPAVHGGSGLGGPGL